jgi:DNA primase
MAGFDLVDFLSTYIEFTSSDEDEHSANCPLCDDTRGRLYVNSTTGLGWCHNCDTSFNSLKAVMTFAGLGKADAMEMIRECETDLNEDRLYKLANTDLYADRRNKTVIKPLLEAESPDFAVALGPKIHYRWEDNDHVKAAIEYLEGRGVSRKQMGRNHIHAIVYGKKYEGRVAIPVIMDGKAYSWVYRAVDPDAEKKVVNAKGNQQRRLLYNWDRASTYKNIVVAEGVFDALRIGPMAVATFGKKISDAQAALLSTKKFESITVCFDQDAYKETKKYAKSLSEVIGEDADIRVCFLTGTAKDPGESSRDELIKQLKASPRWDSVQWHGDYLKAKKATQSKVRVVR